MADTTPITYVGDQRAVETAYGNAEYGESISVPPDVAGEPPKGEPDEEGFDPGSGFLAQAENWQRPNTKTAIEAKKQRDKRLADEAKAAAADEPAPDSPATVEE